MVSLPCSCLKRPSRSAKAARSSPNTTLTILPVDGVQHTVKAGNSVDSIVAKYGGNKADVVSYNDLELTGSLTEGRNIIVSVDRKSVV